jgi:peptide/nickel transport system ATP-binding protein
LKKFTQRNFSCSGTLSTRPQHPYTKALLSAVPVPDPEAARKGIIRNGNAPSPPAGAAFHTQ